MATTASLASLPKTIEAARKRYLLIYRRKFKGSDSDKRRLSNICEAKILKLRKKAPTFFETKLPVLVNQAASDLLLCDVSTNVGATQFHKIHSAFLHVLDELRNTQPDGDVNFQRERDRVQQKKDLSAKYRAILQEIEELQATEIDNDDLGEEEEDIAYIRLMNELDKKKSEANRYASLIAKMEGVKDELPEFELKYEKRSCLERLTDVQKTKLTELIQEFIDQNENKKSMYDVDKSHIDTILNKIGIEPGQFNQVERNQLSKESLDAYKTFFREIQEERREEYHEKLLRNPNLRPKEGLILESPDDIPEEVKQKLNDSSNIFKRQIAETLEQYGREPCDETVADEIGDEDGQDKDEDDDIEEIYVKQNPWLFARVKEEPRDDYDNDAPSGDEMIVESAEAETYASTLGVSVDRIQVSKSRNEQDDDEEEDGSGQYRENGNNENQDDEDDDIQDLGVVEPHSKIEEIIIDDD